MEGHQLFHEVMKILVKLLMKAGCDGVRMHCADGFICKAYPTFAAYIADYPKQCLVVGCKENACPQCTVPLNQHGDPIYSIEHDPNKTIEVLCQKAHNKNPKEFNDWSLHSISPFWINLPCCNIFACITPDLLHQLHKGVFKDHIIKWATKMVYRESEQIDQ